MPSGSNKRNEKSNSGKSSSSENMYPSGGRSVPWSVTLWGTVMSVSDILSQRIVHSRNSRGPVCIYVLFGIFMLSRDEFTGTIFSSPDISKISMI